MAEFELPMEIVRAAQMDGIPTSETVLRIFRDNLRYDNPLARPEAAFFVLSHDRYESRFYIAGSFSTDVEAISFARGQTEEAKSWADEMPVKYYPFTSKGYLISD